MKVKFKGSEVALAGVQKNVGDMAAEVALVNKDLGTTKVGGAQGKYQVINVAPSLDTGVCAAQTRRFNTEASKLSNATVYVVTMDLPFAQGRFCTTEGIENVIALSDFNGNEFAKAYGLKIAEGPLAGLLTRAVIIVDASGKIVYQEICPEITEEPNYEAALAALK